jgi:hypothetical protein
MDSSERNPKEFKRMMLRTINKSKKNMFKYLNELKKNTSNQKNKRYNEIYE